MINLDVALLNQVLVFNVACVPMKEISFVVDFHGEKFNLLNITLDTDYKTSVAINMVVLNIANQLKLERAGIVTLTAASMTFVVKDFAIDTDLKTKFVLTFNLENHVYGVKVERQGIESFQVVLMADKQEILLTKAVFETDMTTKINVIL